MSVGIFADKNKRPGKSEIKAILGKTNSLWEMLAHYIHDQFEAEEDFSFLYGKNYGWALRFRVRGKLLICMYPNAYHFITQIILSTRNLSDAVNTDLHTNTLKAIEIATLYSEGKWLFIATQTIQDINDIKMLLNLKTQKHLKFHESSHVAGNDNAYH